MSNSNLVDVTMLSPNCTKREGKISKITIHHMAGNLSVESCGKVFAPKSRKASSNYGIGSDGRVGLYVDEGFRSWASSNKANDEVAVTIEVADSSNAAPWTITDKAYAKLIDLCVDICQRNGIKELIWTGDKLGNLTVHRFFKATECPSDYLMAKMPQIAADVNSRLKPQKAQIEPKPTQTIKSTPSTNKALEKAQSKADGHSKGTTLRVTAQSGLNIRSGAGANKSLVGSPLPFGATVVWYGFYTTVGTDKWYLVKCRDVEGYCLSKYLK